MSGGEDLVTSTLSTGPASLVLMATVARRYYLAGQTKVEIGEDLALSRFQVARLLERARASGLVKVSVEAPDGPLAALDLETSVRLQEAYGLRHVVVATSTATEPTALRAQVAVHAAALLQEVVTADDVLGVAWARAVVAMAAQVRGLPPVPVVQMTGALLDDAHEPGEDSSVELVRRLATVGGGPAAYFYAPMVLPDTATAAALRAHPAVARALGRLSTVTKAVAGVGAWQPGESTLWAVSTPDERRALQEAGVVAEFSGVLVDADGSVVRTSLTERLVSVTAEQMAAVPELLLLAYGAAKVPAVRAALRSGLVRGLVTHTSLAQGLLA